MQEVIEMLARKAANARSQADAQDRSATDAENSAKQWRTEACVNRQYADECNAAIAKLRAS